MNRRIPAALGIVIVIAALREMSSLVPLVTMTLTSHSALDGFVLVYVGGALAQLVAGIAISIGWTHARLAVLAWTLVSLAIVVFARENLFAEGLAAIAVAVELLAGPAIVWTATTLAGDLPPPRIPRAQIAGAAPALDPLDVFARRFDVGVVLFGIGILWIVNAVLSQTASFAMILRADRVSDGGGIAGELVYLAYAVTVGVLAITAAKRCLDPRVEGQHVRRALATFVLVAVIGTVLRTGLMIGYLSLSDSFDHLRANVIINTVAGAALGCTPPLFLWFYAQPALAYRAEGPPALPSPARLASAPAWALVWIAPFLLVRMFAAQLYDTHDMATGGLVLIGIVCAIEGVLFVIAAIATLAAARASGANTMPSGAADRTLGVARVTAMIGLVVAILVVAGWLFLTFTTDQPMGFRGRVGSLVPLVAGTATLWWALSKTEL